MNTSVLSEKEKNESVQMSQSNPDLSLTEILWEDLRRAMQMPTNLNEQKQS